MSEWIFVRRVLIVFALAALALALWTLSDLLLIIFAAILSAVALRALMGPIVRATGMPETLALLIVVLSIVAIIGAVILQFGSLLAEQTAYVVQNAPAALQSLLQTLQLEDISKTLGGTAIGEIVSRMVTVGSSVIEGATAFVLIVVGGIYLAASPRTYRRGLISIFPERWRGAITSTVDDSGFALGRWLYAQLIAMIIVGVLTGIGMWMVGVPSPLALGLIAGLMEFIPILGPIVGAIPALLLASGQGVDVMLWALGVAVVVQQLESNVVMPFIVGRVVELPAAVGLFATIAMGLLLGPLGLLLGYPLAIVADIAVRRLYMRETLGKSVEIPAERERKAEAAVKAVEET